MLTVAAFGSLDHGRRRRSRRPHYPRPVLAYLAVGAVVAAMTLTPLPLPPTWLLLVYAQVEFDLAAVPLVLAGALGATLGRTGLAALARHFGDRLLRPATRANVDYLAGRLGGTRSRLGMAALLAASPPPSGALFTAAGILRVSLPLVAVSSFVGRASTYGLGVALGGVAAAQAADRLRESVGPLSAAVGVAAVAAVLWLLVRLDWRALLERRRLSLRRPGGGA
jgi:membrane protein YqaA with SNARE-associated domain